MRHRHAFALFTALALAAPLTVAAGLPTGTLAPPEPVQAAIGCDPLDPALCLFPFPNDHFTVADESTDTGLRLNLLPTAMPRNGVDPEAEETGGVGKPVDPTEWNRNDGFSPGSMLLTYVEGIDLHRTWGSADEPHSDAGDNEPGYFDHRDHIADISRYLDPDAPMVIIDAATGERHPFWSELDTHPETTDDRRALILRPAVNFTEGARYIVALRDLEDANGDTIEAGSAFAAYRDGTATDARAEHMDGLFTTLEDAGIARDELYLAWDFTVASGRNLAERMLTMRDDAFARILGDEDLADREVAGDPPAFVVDSVEARSDTWTDSRGVEHTQQLRRVHGRITVPNYMDRVQQTEGHVRANELPYDAPVPLSRLYDDPLDADTLPDQNPVEVTVEVPFTCDVPTEGTSYGVLYGHGLLGTRSQIGDVKWPRRFGFAGCGLDWWGMSSPDLPTVAAIIADLSHFASLPDRAQQGFLNFLFAGRAMVHPEGFVSDAAFQDALGNPLLVVDEPGDGVPTQLYYDGNSQGGIMGGSLVAVSPDIHRGILGVPGMNYSTLLQRSVDWEGLYAIPFYAIYQDPLERQLAFTLIQILWDRGEANGFAAHMTDDPYDNTPAHEVMLQVAFADHQVTNIAAEVEARTIRAPIVVPGLASGRHWEATPFFGATSSYPYRGSSLIYWDSGNATPPNGNVPAEHNGDPHGDPRNEPAAGWQEAHFLLTGWNVDVCGGAPYLTNDHPANDGAVSCVEPDVQPGDPRAHETG